MLKVLAKGRSALRNSTATVNTAKVASRHSLDPAKQTDGKSIRP